MPRYHWLALGLATTVSLVSCSKTPDTVIGVWSSDYLVELNSKDHFIWTVMVGITNPANGTRIEMSQDDGTFKPIHWFNVKHHQFGVQIVNRENRSTITYGNHGPDSKLEIDDSAAPTVTAANEASQEFLTTGAHVFCVVNVNDGREIQFRVVDPNRFND